MEGLILLCKIILSIVLSVLGGSFLFKGPSLQENMTLHLICFEGKGDSSGSFIRKLIESALILPMGSF